MIGSRKPCRLDCFATSTHVSAKYQEAGRGGGERAGFYSKSASVDRVNCESVHVAHDHFIPDHSF